MSSEWEISELGKEAINASRTFSFKQHPKVVFVNTGDVLSGKFLHETVSDGKGLPGQAKKALKRNDILLTEIRPGNGRYAYVDFDASNYVVSTKFMVIESLGRVSPRFLYHVLTNQDALDEFQRIAESRSGTFPQITFDSIAHFPVPVPPRSEQEKLVEFLDALDDRITLLHETNATLEAIAQTLFKSWFVDFDPVRAKMEGRAPEGMDEATAALFPDSFEESELGMVPKGWKLTPFGELLAHTIGGDWGSEVPDEKNDIRVAIVRGTDIPDLQAGTENRVPVRYTSVKKLATRKLVDGDIVLEVSGGSKDQPTGRALYLTAGLLDQFDCPVEPASFCRLLRPSTKNIGVVLAQHLAYIYAEGKTWEYQNQSTGIANFQTTHFLETELVVVPSDDILNSFADLVGSLIHRAHLTQIRELSSLRDTLLPRLISGQLRLPEANALLEGVA